LSRFGFAALAPQPADQSFDNWWRKVDEAAKDLYKSGLNSLIILGASNIWRHRNDCVFNGAFPNVSLVLALAREEAHWWSLAGAKGISLLTAGGSA
jgi:nuclear pore complex protein Nup210